jgi:hypothetical protein
MRAEFLWGLSANMAKLERGARTQAVKQYVKDHPTAGLNDVVAGLKEQGMTVSASLVSKIKYAKPGVTGTKRAKRGGKGNQSEVIRDYFTDHPEAKPKQVQTALAKRGLKVSTGLISNVKHTFLKRQAAPKVRVAARMTTSSGLTFEQLVEVKRFADSVGGIDMLRSALDSLQQLQ